MPVPLVVGDWLTVFITPLPELVAKGVKITPMFQGRRVKSPCALIRLLQTCGAVAGTSALQAAVGGAVPEASSVSAYCWALIAAVRARCFSRVLPAIFSCMP